MILLLPIFYANFHTPQLVTIVNGFTEQMCTVFLEQWGYADHLWEPLSEAALTASMRAYLPPTPRQGNSLKVDL